MGDPTLPTSEGETMPTFYAEDYDDLVATGAVIGSTVEPVTKVVAAPEKTNPKTSTVAEVK